jgi:hypothetical protein
MQNLPFSRYFNFQKNSIKNHAYNIAALSHWSDITARPISHNNCLNILANAFGYKSYNALNSAIKSNELFETLQPVEIYLERLKQAEYLNLSEMGSKDFFNRNYRFFELVASYITTCGLDLNKLDSPSPLKDLYLSSEQTIVSTFVCKYPNFIDYAILNTVVATTYDHGLPNEIILDERIIKLYSGPECEFYSSSSQYLVKLDLFGTALKLNTKSGTNVVYFSEQVHLEFDLLAEHSDKANSRKTIFTLGKYAFDYPKQLFNIRCDNFEAPKSLLKITNDTLKIFKNSESLHSVVTVHENSLFFDVNVVIFPLLKNFIFKLPTHNLSGVDLNLFLTDDLVKDRIKHIGDFDFEAKRIRCKVIDKDFTLYFYKEIVSDNKNTSLQVKVNIPISIEYLIDCNHKPSITVQALQVLDNDQDVNFHVQMDENANTLKLSASYKANKKFPYSDQLKNMLNQHLNCHAFEIGCFYHVLKKHIESSPISLR